VIAACEYLPSIACRHEQSATPPARAPGARVARRAIPFIPLNGARRIAARPIDPPACEQR